MGNLSFHTTKDELTRLLSEAGSIADAYLPADRETGRPRGFAFVTFSSEAEAAEAIRLFHEREVGGRKLVVNAAEARPRRSAGPGPFRPSGPPPGPFGDRASRDRPFKSKGSRRGLRGRKRSL